MTSLSSIFSIKNIRFIELFRRLMIFQAFVLCFGCGNSSLRPEGVFEQKRNEIRVVATYNGEAPVIANSVIMNAQEQIPFLLTVSRYDAGNNRIGSLQFQGGFEGVEVLDLPLDIRYIGSMQIPSVQLQIPGYAGCHIELQQTLTFDFRDSDLLFMTVAKTYTFATVSVSQTCEDLYDQVAVAIQNGTPLSSPFDMGQRAGVLNELIAGNNLTTLSVQEVTSGVKI